MARRSRGDGSVFWDAARGCWVGQVDAGRDTETGRRRRPKVSAPTKDECKELVRRLLEEKRKTGTVARRDTTVETVVRARLDNPPERVKSPVSQRVHEAHGARIIAALGKRRLVKLTPGDVDRFLAGMAADGYAAKTIADTRRLLADAIRRAERDGLVGRNVAALADLPAAGVKKSRAMTLAQVGALLGSDLDAWHRAYVSTGVMCGLRPGELLGLLWANVDLDNRVIQVRGKLKNDQSRRTLVMPAVVAGALRALRAQQAADRLKLGAGWQDSGAVFAREDGSQPSERTAYGRFQTACSRAGLGPGWHPHEMRHTFVSVLSAHGVDIDDIADAAGHVNATVTRVVYRHQISDKVARGAAAMDQIFGTGGA